MPVAERLQRQSLVRQADGIMIIIMLIVWCTCTRVEILSEATGGRLSVCVEH